MLLSYFYCPTSFDRLDTTTKVWILRSQRLCVLKFCSHSRATIGAVEYSIMHYSCPVLMCSTQSRMFLHHFTRVNLKQFWGLNWADASSKNIFPDLPVWVRPAPAPMAPCVCPPSLPPMLSHTILWTNLKTMSSLRTETKYFPLSCPQWLTHGNLICYWSRF